MIYLSPSGGDDTVAIQTAIKSLPSGGILHFGPGVYSCGTIFPAANITFEGEGGAVSILRLNDSANIPLLKVSAAMSGIHIRHLGLDGNKANNATAGHPVEFAGVTDSSITHCSIFNSRQNGIRWDGCTGNLIAFNQVYGNTYCGIRCGETGTSVHTRIIGNYSLNNSVIGISVDSVSRFVISGNVCNNNGDNGIDLCASKESIVSNNECLSNTNQGIALDGWTYVGGSVNDCVVTANVCMYNGQYGFDTANLNNRLIVTNNNLTANTLGPLRDTGTGTGKKIIENMGFVTENSGTAQIPQGATYVDISHGLGINPGEKNVQVTRSSLGGGSTKFWLSNVGSSTFRINSNVDPGAGGCWFDWMIIRAS